jgi:DNA-binding CsgD family transcriptional regulator
MNSVKNKICKAYTEESLSCRAIARNLNISEATVYYILKSNGIKLRDKSEANKIFPDRVLINLYNMALSAKQIGTILGIHPTTVTKRLSKLNFPVRSKEMAQRIKYTEEEFQKYFMNQDFILKIING